MNAGRVSVRSKLSNTWVGALVVCVGVLVASRGGAEVLSGRLYPTDPVPGDQNRADLTLEAETNECTPQVDCPSDTQTSHVLAERAPDQSHIDLSYDTDSNQATVTDLVLVGEDIHFFLNVVIQPRVEEIRVSLDPSLPGPTASVDPITGAFTVSADVLVHGIIRMSAGGTPYPFDNTASLVLEGNLTFSKIGAGEGAFLIENGGASLSPMWQTFFGITFWISGQVYLEMQTETPPLTEQVHNGSFETGPELPEGWAKTKQITSMDKRICTQAHTGSCSFVMSGNGKQKRITQLIGQGGDPGGYTFSAWTKTSKVPATGGFRVGISFIHADTTRESFVVQFPRGTHAWQQSMSVLAPTLPFTQVRVTLEYAAASGRALFDDVSLQLP